MNANLKTRMCWNCEGRVALKEETCPYCGVSVVPASLDGSEEAMPSPYQSLFAQYPSENAAPIPPSPYASLEDMPGQPHAHCPTAAHTEPDEQEDVELPEAAVDGFKSSFLAILFLLGGSVLFLFGLTLALFSHEGVFTLSWDATLWFIYGGLSLPLLLLGWRILSKLEDEH